MHGLGNDFVVLDARKNDVCLTAAGARALADRHRGIGCDQIIVVEPPQSGGHARLIFWNADGSLSGACGNGTRCAAGWLMQESALPQMTLETAGGHLLCSARTDGTLAVDMGQPRTAWREIPLARAMDTLALDLTVPAIGSELRGGGAIKSPVAVNMGNPHCVFFVDSLESVDLGMAGHGLEHNPLFPERANISIAEVLSKHHLKAQTWERGAGLTLACGSAACAVLVAAARRGLSERRATVTMPGGDLQVEWRAEDNRVILSGPWTESFQGTIPAAALRGQST